MALSNQDAKVLQDIVNLEGKCMDSNRCKLCPFRVMCLPEFLNPKPPTTQQREKMAIDVLAHHALVDEELSTEDLRADYQWDRK